MVSKVLLVLSVLVAVAVAVPPGLGWGGANAAAGNPWAVGGPNPFIPQWVSPWIPQWTPCTTVGASCVDCSTRQICTKIGGIARACTDPTLPYCNLGECSATPTTECAPVAAVPATV